MPPTPRTTSSLPSSPPQHPQLLASAAAASTVYYQGLRGVFNAGSCLAGCLAVVGLLLLLLLLHLHLLAKFHTHVGQCQCQFEHSSAWFLLNFPTMAGGPTGLPQGKYTGPEFPLEKMQPWQTAAQKERVKVVLSCLQLGGAGWEGRVQLCIQSPVNHKGHFRVKCATQQVISRSLIHSLEHSALLVELDCGKSELNEPEGQNQNFALMSTQSSFLIYSGLLERIFFSFGFLAEGTLFLASVGPHQCSCFTDNQSIDNPRFLLFWCGRNKVPWFQYCSTSRACTPCLTLGQEMIRKKIGSATWFAKHLL